MTISLLLDPKLQPASTQLKPVVLKDQVSCFTLSIGIGYLQGYVKRMKALRIKLDQFYDHVLDGHMRIKKELAKDFVAQDMVDILLQLADDPDPDIKLTYDCVRAFTQSWSLVSSFIFIKSEFHMSGSSCYPT
ncbi:hypothetical protein V6N13_025928 [Hibiscus sabdariffa]